MNNPSTLSKNTVKKTWRHLFIGILAIQAILEFGVGGSILFAFPTALETGFGITYNSELDALGIALGLYLLLLTALIILSILWTTRANYSGITLGIIVGVFLVAFGLVTFFKLGDFNAILVDGIRGLVTIILGYLAGKELKQQLG